MSFIYLHYFCSLGSFWFLNALWNYFSLQFYIIKLLYTLLSHLQKKNNTFFFDNNLLIFLFFILIIFPAFVQPHKLSLVVLIHLLFSCVTDSCILRERNITSVKNTTFCLSANVTGSLSKLLNLTTDNRTYVSPSEEYFKWGFF